MFRQKADPVSLRDTTLSIRISHSMVSQNALLKTCYWFSRDFVCDVKGDGDDYSIVTLKSKGAHEVSAEELRENFTTHAIDFELRERISAKTSEVRDLLLAKAFSESGVLEEQPQGVFGDLIEEENPKGMFKILSNG
jgi:His-Xaa-Ser system protein HxsD